MTTATATPTVTFPLVAPGEFPHGLACSCCKRPIHEGQPYSEAPVDAPGVRVVELLCAYCTVPAVAPSP